MSNRPIVLVIDDELQIRRLLKRTLEANDYKVLLAETGEEGIRRARMDRPELVILDLGLPDIDGMRVLKEIRQVGHVPVVILSVRNSEEDIIGCLNAGADDYLVKPFRSGELIARLRTALRHRPGSNQDEAFVAADLFIDLEARMVKKSGEQVKLTPTEFNLLSLFVRNAGRVLTHKYILEEIWGPAFEGESQYSRVYVGQLRKKLEKDPMNPKLILTESGIGYRFAAGM